MIGINACPGFWCDYYMCRKDNIVNTIKRMIEEQESDKDSTCCVGFTVVEAGEFVKIYPKVYYREANKVIDYAI